jgi:hypothetical protein
LFGRKRRQWRAFRDLVLGPERDWRMGLAFMSLAPSGWKLGYRVGGGFGHGWMPRQVQTAIATVWNKTACWLLGHDELDESVFTPGGKVICVSCSKELR